MRASQTSPVASGGLKSGGNRYAPPPRANWVACSSVRMPFTSRLSIVRASRVATATEVAATPNFWMSSASTPAHPMRTASTQYTTVYRRAARYDGMEDSSAKGSFDDHQPSHRPDELFSAAFGFEQIPP